MTLHINRLHADYKEVSSVFKNHQYVKLINTQGNPPDKYLFEINVAGLVPSTQETFSIGTAHKVEVFLPLDYPRLAPFCRMLTPVFHPNIDPQKICIGDHWSAAQSLPLLVVHIAEMLCYQSYNVKSPLNAKAAVWTEENFSKLPLQKADLTAGL